jgi:hypothetical protein
MWPESLMVVYSVMPEIQDQETGEGKEHAVMQPKQDGSAPCAVVS